MNIFDDSYELLSNKSISNDEKIKILETYTTDEILNFISEIYIDMISEADNKTKNDDELMKETRVYKILKDELNRRKIKNLEIKFE